MPPPASKFLPSVWRQSHRIGPHNDLILTWSSAKILFPDRIHRGWVCGPQHLLKDTVYSVTPPPFLILTAYIWKGNFTCQLKLVLVYEMSSCFLKNSSEWTPSSCWQKEKGLWGKHRDKTRYLLGREQLRGALAREQSKEEIWITPCYRFLFPSIQTLLHTSLEQRLIYQNPINSTLDDGQWIWFLLCYLWNRPLWISLETSPTVYNVVFLRMQSDALAWQMHLQSTVQHVVEISWGNRASQVETSWHFSPSHIRVLRGCRRALWAILLLPAGRLAPTWCPFGQQGWTFMCLKDFPWELGSCPELTPLGHLQRHSAVSPISMVPFCFMDITDFCQGLVMCSVKRLCLITACPHS